jgi:Leucine-rich repeat (LRR) protein
MPDNNKTNPPPNGKHSEAVRRILAAEKSGQTWLDLGDLGLEELPEELEQLTRLQHLALGSTSLKFTTGNHVSWQRDRNRPKPLLNDLWRISHLVQLTTLNISGCWSVTDLGPLRELTALTTLDISGCGPVTDLGIASGEVASCGVS